MTSTTPAPRFTRQWRSLMPRLASTLLITFLVLLCCLPQPVWHTMLRPLRWISWVVLALVWLARRPIALFSKDDAPALWFGLALLPSVLLVESPRLGWSELAGETIGIYPHLILMGVAWYVIAAHTIDHRRLQWLGRWFVVGALCAAAIGYVEILTHHNIIYERWVPNPDFYHRSILQHRMMSTQMHPVIMGTLLVLSVPLALHHTVVAIRTKARWLWGIAAASVIGATLLTFTRGSALSLIVAITSYAVVTKRRRWLWGLALGIVALVVVSSVMTARSHTRTTRGPARYSLSEFQRIIQGRTASWRWDNACLALNLMRQSPVWGIGLNHFRHQFNRHRPAMTLPYEWKIPDDLYLRLLVETGLLGCLSFLWLLWKTARRWYHTISAMREATSRSLLAAVGAGWLGLLTHMLTYDALWWLMPLACFWIWTGILHSHRWPRASHVTA